MADEILDRDENNQPVIGLVTDDAAKEIRMGRIDDTTKGLKVMIVGGVGAGTVTSVSVVTANGISGTVANPTTTPAITLSLGAITPSSVQVSGLTASKILATDASKNLVSLDVATYPSLTELSYVKGVTSAIQTQINAKGVGTVTAVSVATANGISGSSSGGATPALTIALGAITPTSVNGLTLASQAVGFTIAGGTSAKTATIAGNFTTAHGDDLTLTTTGATNITLPTTGTLAILGANTFTGLQTFVPTAQTVTAMAAQALNGSLGNVFTRTLAGNETFTQSNFTVGQFFIVRVKQGSGTSYAVTWFATINWITPGATAPVQTVTTNGYTTYGFMCTGSNTFDGYLISSQ